MCNTSLTLAAFGCKITNKANTILDTHFFHTPKPSMQTRLLLLCDLGNIKLNHFCTVSKLPIFIFNKLTLLFILLYTGLNQLPIYQHENIVSIIV